MKSVVELDVSVPKGRLSEMFLNPELSTEWMDDVERYEAISGEPGMPGWTFGFLYLWVGKIG
jgi:hypothetical protein